MKFADELDRAAHIAQIANETAVKEISRKARPEQMQNADGTWPIVACIDCDLEIEDGRLALGKVRCFECQSKLEKRVRLHVR